MRRDTECIGLVVAFRRDDQASRVRGGDDGILHHGREATAEAHVDERRARGGGDRPAGAVAGRKPRGIEDPLGNVEIRAGTGNIEHANRTDAHLPVEAGAAEPVVSGSANGAGNVQPMVADRAAIPAGAQECEVVRIGGIATIARFRNERRAALAYGLGHRQPVPSGDEVVPIVREIRRDRRMVEANPVVDDGDEYVRAPGGGCPGTGRIHHVVMPRLSDEVRIVRQRSRDGAGEGSAVHARRRNAASRTLQACARVRCEHRVDRIDIHRLDVGIVAERRNRGSHVDAVRHGDARREYRGRVLERGDQSVRLVHGHTPFRSPPTRWPRAPARRDVAREPIGAGRTGRSAPWHAPCPCERESPGRLDAHRHSGPSRDSRRGRNATRAHHADEREGRRRGDRHPAADGGRGVDPLKYGFCSSDHRRGRGDGLRTEGLAKRPRDLSGAGGVGGRRAGAQPGGGIGRRPAYRHVHRGRVLRVGHPDHQRCRKDYRADGALCIAGNDDDLGRDARNGGRFGVASRR